MPSTDVIYACTVCAALENEIVALTEMRRLFDFLPLNNKQGTACKVKLDTAYAKCLKM